MAEAVHRILIECPDSKGLVYKISSVFFDAGLNMLVNNEFVDREQERFFMRSVVDGALDAEALEGGLRAVLPPESVIRIIPPRTKRIVLMVTKEPHALGDLLIRYEDGELDAEIVAVLSHHAVLAPLVEKFGLPFHHVSHEGLPREAHEVRMIEAIRALGTIDYIVLAKYMRILTPAFVGAFSDRIINIHHSFLPAFIGANPYKQAYERGVKIIGATAHFVNNELDEGPIIAQDVLGVNHAYDWQAMQRAGRDVEKIVLSRALKLALEDRIFVHGNKTVIF